MFPFGGIQALRISSTTTNSALLSTLWQPIPLLTPRGNPRQLRLQELPSLQP
jgi:hypothetical protein